MRRLFLIPLMLLFCLPHLIDAQIRDLINSVKLFSGRTDTVIISDLFYAKNYDLVFKHNKDCDIKFNEETLQLIVTPRKSFSGLTLIEFSMNENTYHILADIAGSNNSFDKQTHTFKYKTTGQVKEAYVFGSFNGWNKQSNLLKDDNNDGVFENTVSLDPGNYTYKFIVDGNEMVDPENPEKAPTGFDDFNSVLMIPEVNDGVNFLHKGTIQKDNNKISLSFNYEGDNSKLFSNDITALTDNRQIPPADISINGNAFKITINQNDLKGEHVIRTAVSKNGRSTNLQTVFLADGKPADGNLVKWNDGVIYSIMIDRFNDGDKTINNPVEHDSLFPQANYHGGDLQGIVDKIEEGYFDSLGINILWISPVYDNPDKAFREYPKPHRWYSGYHGYWPVSAEKVEENFGTMAKLKELISTAHKHNIRVLLDFVAHHTHIDHPWFKEHPEWFGKLQLPDGRLNLRFWDEFRLTTWFEPYMPSFDFLSSPEALKAMTENAVWWLKETGADGFRHDAVKHVPNEFWRELTRLIKEEIEIPENKTVYQIGETFGEYELINSYVNNGQLSAQFNFNLSYFAIPVFTDPIKSFTTIDHHMKKSFSVFGYNNVMGNIMDSHDKVRFMAYADSDIPEYGVDTREIAWTNPPKVDDPNSYKEAELYFAYMLSIPGLPVIYYGSEFGMTGADDPDNRRMMRFDGQLSSNEKELLKATRSIVKIRNEHPALRYGDFLTLNADQNTYAYIRSDFNERILVVMNKAAEQKQLELKIPSSYGSTLKELGSAEKFKSQDGAIQLSIPSLSWKMYKIE